MGAAHGSRPLSCICALRSLTYCLSLMFSDSMCSVCPLEVARPVMRSVVLHSRLFCRHGEQPPGRASHLILRTCMHRQSPVARRLSGTWSGSRFFLLTLHRSHAWPVRDVPVSFLRTDPEKSPPFSVLGNLFGVPSEPDSLGRLTGMFALLSELRYIPCLATRYNPFKLGDRLCSSASPKQA